MSCPVPVSGVVAHARGPGTADPHCAGYGFNSSGGARRIRQAGSGEYAHMTQHTFTQNYQEISQLSAKHNLRQTHRTYRSNKDSSRSPIAHKLGVGFIRLALEKPLPGVRARWHV